MNRADRQPNLIDRMEAPLSPAGLAEEGEDAPVTGTVPAGPDPLADIGATPVMAQYLAIKREHPDSLLFFRMGDFYELFFEDAVKAAGALDIALTKRGKHLGEDIAMCGVPVVSHEAYLSRLIRKGFKVAVCEQVEDPAEAKKRGSKAVVKREVVRVITPGTLTEDTLLDARRNNFLAALAEAEGGFGLAWVDVSTGSLQAQGIEATALGAALARLAPGELLVPEAVLQRPALFEMFRDLKDRLTPLPTARFDSVNGRKRLEAAFSVATLDAFGAFARAEVAALGALLDYVHLTQKGKLPRLTTPRRIAPGAVMEIDGATRRNLELNETLSGERKGSLLSAIDRTLTGGGARLFALHLGAPLTDPDAINRRLDMVEFFVQAPKAREDLRECLRRCPDFERALGRLSLGRGGPRDLAALRDGLAGTADARAAVQGGSAMPAGLEDALQGLGHHKALVGRLMRALAPELPVWTRDGGFIAPAYSGELDELRKLRDESRQLMAGLQTRYAAETGISVLKVRHNNVLGYFVEVPAKQSDKMPVPPDGPFRHRQTLANAMRYTTPELAELEGQIAKAAERALSLELKLFDDLAADVAAQADAIAEAAQAMAALDIAQGLAELAADHRYCRPTVDRTFAFSIKGGRHPVVEAALRAGEGRAFVANDCDLAPGQRLWLLTGPNMAGKSTFLRQNALIAVMAQIGSFVPADSAHIGTVDRLFSRVGAADDLARGRSTFMVEMVETAAILNQSGERALVILDEIGRGTATFDGLSIAWAVIEHLHEVNRCRALFATHYHELTMLAARLADLSCHAMRVKEWQGDVVFLHEVAPGAADRSYGIHVARLAGLPPATIARAEEVLSRLESGERASAAARLAGDLPLFVADAPAVEPKQNEIERSLREASPDGMSPKEALEFLYRLKGLLP